MRHRTSNRKDQEVITEIAENRLDVYIISEVKKKRKGKQLISDYVLTYSGNKKDDRAVASLGILTHNKFRNFIKEIYYIDERLLAIKLKLVRVLYTQLVYMLLM